MYQSTVQVGHKYLLGHASTKYNTSTSPANSSRGAWRPVVILRGTDLVRGFCLFRLTEDVDIPNGFAISNWGIESGVLVFLQQ